jgi:hypothetical protein
MRKGDRSWKPYDPGLDGCVQHGVIETGGRRSNVLYMKTSQLESGDLVKIRAYNNVAIDLGNYAIENDVMYPASRGMITIKDPYISSVRYPCGRWCRIRREYMQVADAGGKTGDKLKYRIFVDAGLRGSADNFVPGREIIAFQTSKWSIEKLIDNVVIFRLVKISE